MVGMEDDAVVKEEGKAVVKKEEEAAFDIPEDISGDDFELKSVQEIFQEVREGLQGTKN